MDQHPRFEIFIDCLWGASLFGAWHLFPFSYLVDRGLSVGSSLLWLHGLILLTFAYIYGLRLRRHLRFSRQETGSEES